MTSVAVLEQRVMALEQRVEYWDNQFGELLSCSAQARDGAKKASSYASMAKDASERAANEVVKLQADIRALHRYMNRQCDDRHRKVDERFEELEEKTEAGDQDEFDATTDVMDRDQLVSSRHQLKQQLRSLRGELSKLQQAEAKRAQVEHDIAIEKQARAKVEADYKKQATAMESHAKQLKTEKLKAHVAIAVAIIGMVGTITAAYLMR